HFNGQRIDLLHFGPAHTTGDTAVIFRELNVVHLGDVFNNAGYPFIDADNGGSLAGIVDFCRGVLDEIDENAVVIPGHGPVSNYGGLADYVAMLSTIRDRIAALVESGATLEQVVAARPTAEWDEARGDPANFIDRAYTSMTR
ncbi:MAG TPA: MBL fold metallo-hydrolase, partial [Gammaproteobacteria bacterium]